jgi:hypothetical protein
VSVCAGIDVHRKRSQVAVVTGDGTVQLNNNVVNGPGLRRVPELPGFVRHVSNGAESHC